MPVKIRLQRKGRKKRPFYHIVAADVRAPRDGKFIERLGFFNPVENPGIVRIDVDRVLYWIKCGAQPTPTVKSLLSKTGVLYRKHLLRGVDKGALSQEQADRMYEEWLNGKAKKTNLIVALEAWKEDGDGAPSGAKIRKPAMGPGDEAVKEEAPAPVEEAKEEAPVPVEEAKEEAPAYDGKYAKFGAEDLKVVEGIGPKIEEALKAGGVGNWEALASADVEKLKEILTNAEGNFAAHDPGTWPKQAQMAHEGKFEELEKWQDELDGGKE